MSTHTALSRFGVFALAGALVLGASACEDDPVGPGEEHGDPVSVRLMLGGVEIASATSVGVGTTTGEIQLHPSEETDHISVQFLDEDGDVIDFDDDFHLDVIVGNEDVAEFEQDTPGEFGGHAHGVAVGETTMQFRLMHGAVGDGHPDFSSALIDVVVVDDA